MPGRNLPFFRRVTNGLRGKIRQGPRIEIRVDNGRFAWKNITRYHFGKHQRLLEPCAAGGSACRIQTPALLSHERNASPTSEARIVSRVSAVLKRLNVEVPEETCRTTRQVEG